MINVVKLFHVKFCLLRTTDTTPNVWIVMSATDFEIYFGSIFSIIFWAYSKFISYSNQFIAFRVYFLLKIHILSNIDKEGRYKVWPNYIYPIQEMPIFRLYISVSLIHRSPIFDLVTSWNQDTLLQSALEKIQLDFLVSKCWKSKLVEIIQSK